MKDQVEARNELESYSYSLKNQLNDKEKLGGKLSDEDKSVVESGVDETISWLESNQEASTEELQDKKKELEAKIQPIISKLYQGAGGGESESRSSEDKDEL